ncbi:MAG: hypothetical protein LBE79_09550 [Tannerella sp.]|jgi:prenyltransferase beta subunit|nr:hypothetical protein [Tannerella sp.]
MQQKSLSLKLLDTLQQGKKQLSREAVERIAAFVRSQLTENGAFMDKNGRDDLYYTSFGLMLSHVLKLNINTDHTGQWLGKQDAKLSDLVYYSAYIRCRLLCKLLKSGKLNFALSHLFKIKQPLPDFTNYPHGDPNSPYSLFLLLSLKEDMGIMTANHSEMLSPLSSYHAETGGFGNIKGSTQATTNATVAALAIKGQLGGYRIDADVDYLQASQDQSGGFYAGSSTPVPDLLSTATALFLLKYYNVTPRINAGNFIDAHWHPSGGFSATLLDESCDVEYTFYGLLALGAISRQG